MPGKVITGFNTSSILHAIILSNSEYAMILDASPAEDACVGEGGGVVNCWLR